LKNFSKKGFSLLEVMLAVAIMAVASSMIMYGFLTTMNYSNNSSIYARVAAANTNENYDRMAAIIAIVEPTGATGKYATLEDTSDGDRTISVEGVSGEIDTTLDVRYYRYDGDTPGTNSSKFDITNGAVSLDSSYAIAIENAGTYADSTVVDNRTSFFYTVPDVDWAGYSIENGVCPICGEPFSLVMMRRGGEPASNGNFHWVCTHYDEDTPYDHSAYRAAVMDASNW